MIATIGTIVFGFFTLLLVLGLLATGLWIMVPVLLVGLLIWVAVAVGGHAPH
jgi:hypothetical protein